MFRACVLYIQSPPHSGISCFARIEDVTLTSPFLQFQSSSIRGSISSGTRLRSGVFEPSPSHHTNHHSAQAESVLTSCDSLVTRLS